MQRNDKGASVKRARYNSSLIDANVTELGDEYEKLNETYVIFITENDALGVFISMTGQELVDKFFQERRT